MSQEVSEDSNKPLILDPLTFTIKNGWEADMLVVFFCSDDNWTGLAGLTYVSIQSADIVIYLRFLWWGWLSLCIGASVPPWLEPQTGQPHNPIPCSCKWFYFIFFRKPQALFSDWLKHFTQTESFTLCQGLARPATLCHASSGEVSIRHSWGILAGSSLSFQTELMSFLTPFTAGHKR